MKKLAIAYSSNIYNEIMVEPSRVNHLTLDTAEDMMAASLALRECIRSGKISVAESQKCSKPLRIAQKEASKR